MRKYEVLYDKLPKIGDLFEFTSCSDFTITVVTLSSGRRELALSQPGEEAPFVSVPLTRTEATVLATLLTGAHIELKSTPRTWPIEH